jgi:hypothetical protein
MAGFDAYTAEGSMYTVHKFMDLNPYELTYFIDQVAMSAASFGVAESDLEAVGAALQSLFGYRCSPEQTAVAAQGPELQSICIDGACPLSADSTCDAYDAVMIPANATTNATMAAPGSLGTATVSGDSSSSTATGTAVVTASGKASGTASGTASPSTVATAGAAANGLSLAAVIGGVAAFLI